MNLKKAGQLAVAVAAPCMGLGWGQGLAYGGESSHAGAKNLVQQTSVQCHRLKGNAESRFKLHAPDLIWAGGKYQRPWLLRWLTGKEPPLYANNDLWDLTTIPSRHPVLTEEMRRPSLTILPNITKIRV